MSAAKRARVTVFRPEDVTVGTMVRYDGDKQGVVCDAFAALDQFWVRDLETGEKVKNDGGDLVIFSSEQLQPWVAKEQQACPSVRVLLLGTDQQMLRILRHFGQPDISERREPQMLLALPCSALTCGEKCVRFDPRSAQTCHVDTCSVLKLCTEQIDQGMLDLASSLRPDIKDQINVRSYHIKQAYEQLGPDLLKLKLFALVGVTMPYGISDIEDADPESRPLMEDIRCHIDIGVTADGRSLATEATLELTAKRVLAEACGIVVDDKFWSEEVQFKLRRMLNVDIPIRYWDGPEVKGYVIILPADLTGTIEDTGLLAFREPQATFSPGLQDVSRSTAKLPKDWVEMKSRSTGEVYYWNNRTQESTFELPLPEGWTKQVSKSTGKTYYFNAKKQLSVYEPPTE